MSRPAGRVWLVGAGPGDPGLLTVAARRLIDTADAVVHDRLVGPAILATIPAGTLRFDVGKAGYGHATPQDEISGLLVALARRGLDVVRLKGGDPFVFGRGGEEAISLAEAGIPVAVVPGITAGLAGPALAGIPVTHRGLARSLAFVSGHAADDGVPDWSGVAGADTIVVYMGGRSASLVARSLLAAGRSPSTPVALVIDASLPAAHIEVRELAHIADTGIPAHAGAAVLLVIGEVVRLRELTGVARPALQEVHP